MVPESQPTVQLMVAPFWGSVVAGSDMVAAKERGLKFSSMGLKGRVRGLAVAKETVVINRAK